MLQPVNRLKKVRDFNLLIKYGRWINGSCFDLKYVKLNKILDYFPKKEDPDKFKKQLKLAIVVSVKISKSAVTRNRLKRQMRESVRLLIKEGKLGVGYYVMVMAKKGSLQRDYSQVSQEIELLFKKSKILIV